LASGPDSSLSIALLTFLTLLSAALVEMEDNGSYFTPNSLFERSGFLCKEINSLPAGGKISKCRFSFQPLDALIKIDKIKYNVYWMECACEICNSTWYKNTLLRHNEI
jgi:hypothetical protein